MSTPFKKAQEKIEKEKTDLLKKKEDHLVQQIVDKIKQIEKTKELLKEQEQELESLKKTKVEDVRLPRPGTVSCGGFTSCTSGNVITSSGTYNIRF